MEMPKASVDPQTAANIHRLMNACDSFTNAVRGNPQNSQDAQLIYNWFVRQYSLPLEGAAVPALAQRSDRHQRDSTADHKGKRGMRRNEHRSHNNGDHRAEG
jgi:hypothetical protein